MTERRIRNSSITKYKRCKRSWMLGYQYSLETDWSQRTDPKTFDTGTAVHVGVEAFDKGESWPAALRTHYEKQIEDLSPLANLDKWRKEVLEKPLAMLEGYTEWVREEGIGAGEKIIWLEHFVSEPLGTFHGDEVILYGRVDKLVENAHGDLIIDDTKTVAKVEPDITLVQNWQLQNYALLAELELGRPIRQIRHTQIVRNLRGPRSKPPYQGQNVATLTDTIRASHKESLFGVIDDMVKTMQNMEDGSVNRRVCPPSPTRDCSWDCAFKDVCPSMDDGSDWEFQLEEGFRKREN